MQTSQSDERFSLDVIDVAAPCSMSWDAMQGDDRARFCEACKLNVYDLSEMTRSEAEALVNEREGTTCVRLYRRADGTVLTRDCPIGLRELRRNLYRAGAAVATILLMLLLAPVAVFAGWTKKGWSRSFNPLHEVHSWTEPEIVMGVVCIPVTPTPPPANTTGTALPDPSESPELDPQ